MAQSTNVYSLNVVGYVTATIPANSYSIVACPLVASPDNTLNTLLPNATGTYAKVKVYAFSPATSYTIEQGSKTGWSLGGTNTINPGQAVFIFNPNSTALTLTFVGSVASGAQANVMVPNSYNLVSSIVPMSGDLVTNSISLLTNASPKDKIYVYDPVAGYTTYLNGKSAWGPSNPNIPNVAEGFFYENNSATALTWNENFSVSTP
jgi:hypothetical protein